MENRMKELDLQQMEKVAGGAERESAPEDNGNFISWIMRLLFGD